MYTCTYVGRFNGPFSSCIRNMFSARARVTVSPALVDERGRELDDSLQNVYKNIVSHCQMAWCIRGCEG